MESKIEKLKLVNHDLIVDFDRIESKINEIIDHLNSQDQTEENEPEKVYVEPYESANPEGAIKVEWKSREEIADNLQAQFEYGRHGTYKDLESARKVFDKERVKEWDRTAMETYKQATQDTPEQKEGWEFDLRNLMYRDGEQLRCAGEGKPYTGEYRELVISMVKNLLSEREREVLNSMREWVVEYHKDNWDIRDFDAEIAIGKIIDRELDKLNK